MTILELSGGGASLEFARAEWPVIRKHLTRLAGSIRREACATYDRLVCDAAEFALWDEWDDPCLIAGSAAGAALLRAIAAAGDEASTR